MPKSINAFPLFNVKKIFISAYIMSRKVFEILLAKIVPDAAFFLILKKIQVWTFSIYLEKF